MKIEEIYVFVAEDETGEGITGFKVDNQWVPMVGADRELIKTLKPIAKQIAKESGKKIKLLKFTTREELPFE